MKLKRFLLRYYPPGIILEYEQADELRNKSIDLLNLSGETDVELILDQIIQHEPLIKESRRAQLRKLIFKLIEKQELNEHQVVGF
jgi:dynein assembly factor with WDR repeat domains 1